MRNYKTIGEVFKILKFNKTYNVVYRKYKNVTVKLILIII